MAGGSQVSKVEIVVLGSLAEGPRYGYELLEAMRERGTGLWAEVGKASVYQALQRLERRGLVSGRTQEGTDGPDRRVYRITRAGRERLREGLAVRAGEGAPYETDAGLALGFAHLLPPGDARRAVAAREAAVRNLVEAIADERARTKGAAPSASRAVADAMLARQEALARAELAWLGSFRAVVGKARR